MLDAWQLSHLLISWPLSQSFVFEFYMSKLFFQEKLFVFCWKFDIWGLVFPEARYIVGLLFFRGSRQGLGLVSRENQHVVGSSFNTKTYYTSKTYWSYNGIISEDVSFLIQGCKPVIVHLVTLCRSHTWPQNQFKSKVK